MDQSDVLPAPELISPQPTNSKWQRERRAFLQMLPQLLQTHRGKYVAVHEGKVVAAGDDQIVVANQAFATHGYVSMHVGLVIDEPRRVFRSPSARVFRSEDVG